MDRNVKTIADLAFNDAGLVPCIVQDAATKDVLMMAWMNEQAVQLSIEQGEMWFYSRSRDCMWHKGETSGNVQRLVSVTADCDRDALVVEVEPAGPACHLGGVSCFEFPVWQSDTRQGFTADGLMELLAGRKKEMPEGSYTSYLFEKGLDKILKKVGEEATEVIIAGKAEDRRETVYEIADLAYHVMVLMTEAGITLDDVRAELASRHIIDHKVKQEKMV